MHTCIIVQGGRVLRTVLASTCTYYAMHMYMYMYKYMYMYQFRARSLPVR